MESKYINNKNVNIEGHVVLKCSQARVTLH